MCKLNKLKTDRYPTKREQLLYGVAITGYILFCGYLANFGLLLDLARIQTNFYQLKYGL